MKSAKTARALRLPSTYAPWLAALKARVRSAQLIAAARVNHELLRLYWDIGTALVAAQQNEGWGKAVIPRLARDLRTEFPEMQGFSERNLGYMVRFSREYGAPPILQQVAAKLPWFHHVILLEKVKDRAARAWYMQAAVDNGWSRSVLAVQIAQRAHRRAGKAVTNFAATLPPPQSDLAQQTLRDPYVFDFLTLSTAARERELEQGLIDHVQQFLVSLGAGFAFVGRQVHLEVAGEDYYLDLLFYHLKLRCFVVIDLKAREFTPEAAGKMNFYLSAVDDRLRHRDDQPSIGLLLCRGKNRLTVEYALRDVKKPIGVAEWRTRLVASLPKNLRSSLPTVAEIEAELTKQR